MTAVRLRGNDAIERALTVREKNLDGTPIKDLAREYNATPETIHQWLKLAKKHTLPDLDDREAWFNLIVRDQGARLDDAKDADSVRIAQLLSQLIGVGSIEELRAQSVQLEQAKVILIARAFDEATRDAPNRKQLREAFLDAIDAHDVA